MILWSGESRSLPDWVEQGYDVVSTAIAETDGEGLSRDRAREGPLAHETFPEDSADAEYAVEQLLSSVWLYEAGERLYVTTPEH